MRTIYNKGYMSEMPDVFAEEWGLADGQVLYDEYNNVIIGDVKGEACLYRGWMLDEPEYRRLESCVQNAGGHLIVDTSEYLSNHHFPGWYWDIEDLTFQSVILDSEDEIAPALERFGKVFVKDYVKSNTMSSGSSGSSLEHVQCILRQLRSHRGCIEGGVVLREYARVEGERRFFVANGKVFGEKPPAIVHEVASRLRGRTFYVVDVAYSNGELKVVEIGDGQVTSRKEVSINDLMSALKELENEQV